jgi:hypothetical protein
MDHDEAIRRSIPFLQELERKLGLPVISAAPSFPSLKTRKTRQNELPNNPQETHCAPPLATPQQTKLRLPKARRKAPSQLRLPNSPERRNQAERKKPHRRRAKAGR